MHGAVSEIAGPDVAPWWRVLPVPANASRGAAGGTYL